MKTVVLLLIPIILLGCAQVPKIPATELASEYCMDFIYPMCVRDASDDGIVDYMYFYDTNEVFMADRSWLESTTKTFKEHRCYMDMDDNIRKNSSKLLTINSDTSALHKVQLKSSLMLSYAKYLPKINTCMGYDQDLPADDDPNDYFNDEFN